MASKIFMGDMPELMENILKNLKKEFYSLYSCTLVNRYWCEISIPILWQDPFSFDRNPLFISTYFSSLSEYDKFLLREYGVFWEFPKALFDYARFLKILDLSNFKSMVHGWVDLEMFHVRSESAYCSLIHNIIKILVKLFVESGATLHKLDLTHSCYLENEINMTIFDSFRKNELFFSRLQILSLSLLPDFSTEDSAALLRIFAKNATKISTLKIDKIYSDNEPQIFHELIRIIKSQKQLKQFCLISKAYLGDFHGIVSALESQKNSLREVVLEACTYTAEFEVLTNCKSLEILHIRHCNLDLLKILNHKISTLEIVDSEIDVSTIVQYLEKSGSLLQRLKIVSDGEKIQEELLLLDAIESFCPNITYLNFSKIGFSTKLIELIGNLQKLRFLTLRFPVDITEKEEIRIRVIQFAEVLPLTLQYLYLENNNWTAQYIDTFLDNCNAPLKKLIIHDLDDEKYTKALIEFCKRKRTLNYVGVVRYWKLNENFRKKMESYVELVPSRRIVVNC